MVNDLPVHEYEFFHVQTYYDTIKKNNNFTE